MRVAAFVLLLVSALVSSPALAGAPADAVKAIYDQYIVPPADGIVIDNNPELLSARLNALFDDYGKTTSPDEVGALDFDPFISAQDYEIKDFAIASETIAGDTATVGVAFTNFDYQTELTYSLVLEDGAWKVDDIASSDNDWVLSKILKGE